MKKKRKATRPRTPAQIRNWNKRLISCYTSGYQVMLSKFGAGLTSQEKTKIKSMLTIGKSLLSDWPSTVEDDDS